ncbi:MAG: hypothetical protein A2521_01370 [Deltaproteobacteria bacterium RIFOXYD12_FULL_57_12]|nr:MAG: hypothetical protein A2521_01370 [Deltaproteobacteria bacterium RIFOXYD12_FULL_57_12]
MPPFVIPIFVAHQGCPHRCLFCDQHAIIGDPAAQTTEISPTATAATIDTWLARPRRRPDSQVQVAFYGGSFTGMARMRQKALLAAVQPFLADGRVDTIRLSTRPDYVDAETPSFLRAHGVGVVELGVQSMRDAVLAASRRGHTAAQVVVAVQRLRQAGLAVGLQLMLGLPGDSTIGFLDSVRQVAALAPDFVRLYPAVVLRGSGLQHLHDSGDYQPLALNRALALAGRARIIFAHHQIPVVRVGLQPSPELAAKVTAGPYHPAFGELVLSRLFFNTARRLLTAAGPGPHQLACAPADESACRGAGNRNLKRLQALGLLTDQGLCVMPGQARQTVQILGDRQPRRATIFS